MKHPHTLRILYTLSVTITSVKLNLVGSFLLRCTQKKQGTTCWTRSSRPQF